MYRKVTATNAVRVSKHSARKLYNDNCEIVIVGHKMCPFGSWLLGYHVHKADMVERATYDNDAEFDNIAANYASYNCDYEQGYYPAYYVHKNDATDHKINPLGDDD